MSQTLRDDFDTIWRMGFIPQTIPDTIQQNLNPALPLRPYQKEALARFIYYFGSYPDRVKPTQLLFHMATGSGKTLIMAAAIIHLYEQGYRHFLFFVNSTNIIEKTRDNFLNTLSTKYLFANPLKIGPKQIAIREADNFQSGHVDDINLHFTTIQGLHTRLNQPRENSLTYEDFSDRDIVLISDEAHHINALTKTQSSLNQTEMFELNTWEATVNRIFQARPGNLLLEFTATVELSHPAVAAKYADKILFQYDLKQFREDGYSKEVHVLQADLPPMERALQAVILSQYRRKVAEKNGLMLKPVILMKSRIIRESEAHFEEFQEMMATLDAEQLHHLKQQANGILQRAFAYFDSQTISLENLATELRQEFDPHRCLSVNSKSDSEEKQLLVNSLEDRDNPIRVIFAVDKLNEGWDVLNLFDIVRLYDTRDAKKGIPGKTTISEAQLIGHGARYFPFTFNNQPPDQRKFDADLDNQLRILESLYYHSAHNPRYISELHTALIQTGILPERSRTITLRVKARFKDTDFWQNGAIYVNKRIPNPRTDVTDLNQLAVNKSRYYQLQTGQSEELTILDESTSGSSSWQTMTRSVKLATFGKHLLRTALQRLTFFRFDHLRRYLPNLASIDEFIMSPDYLGSVSVDLVGTQAQLEQLSPDEKLRIAVDVLAKIGKEIELGLPEYEGTKVFAPIGIQHCVKDKTIQITVNEGGDQERGVAMSQTTNALLRLDLSGEAWYVYDENYGTSEEKHFVRFLHGMMAKLQQQYAEIYLIRNEKLFTLYTFKEGRAVEPDFVLFAVEKASEEPVIYQLFVEPKGEQLLSKDQWKADFLRQIEQEHNVTTMYANKSYRLVGLPFYNEAQTRPLFAHAFRESLNL
jgi:type III restriction enzyme